MTKLRRPNTVEDAITRILGVLLPENAAAICGNAVSHVRAWSDPDKDPSPTLSAAVKLDVAYVRATGEEPPILSVWQLQVREALRGVALPPALEPRDRLLRCMTEFGDVSRELHAGLQDGVLSQADCIAVLKQANELSRELGLLIAETTRRLPGNQDGV